MRNRIIGTLGVLLFLFLSACTTSGNGTTAPDDGIGDFDFGDCTPVIAAVSSEKVNLFTRLSELFDESEQAAGLETCARIAPVNVASGEAARLLSLDWAPEETNKPQPVIWSPASTSWVSRVASAEGPALVPDPQSFARTPVVLAMPEPMAKKLGWPDTPLGLSDLHGLCADPQGWGRYGGSSGLWGSFKLGKTNPNTSTTGLNTLLMQTYAATGKQSGLTVDDIAAGSQFSREIESCVIHYGDTTGNVLQRVYDRDQQGQPLDYVSAIALEETSLLNYNLGNPTSRVVEEGEQLTPPNERLVAIYPKEGSLESDNPIVVLGKPATWVTDEQRVAAEAFRDFVQTPEAQAVLGDFGFRPVDPTATPTGLVKPEYGVDPTQPVVRLETPSVEVTSAAIQLWEEIRKPSSVLEVIDVSGSMADDAGNGESRMTEAIRSSVSTLDHFRSTDELGVWVFTTGIQSDVGDNIVELRPVTPLEGARETLADELEGLRPLDGTPLYDTISTAHAYMKERAEPGRINAIIVLTDGEDTDSRIRLDDLKRQLRGDAEGIDEAPVRVFPIVYGDASPDALREIAEASGGQVFSATDPGRLQEVFGSVVRNF